MPHVTVSSIEREVYHKPRLILRERFAVCVRLRLQRSKRLRMPLAFFDHLQLGFVPFRGRFSLGIFPHSVYEGTHK